MGHAASWGSRRLNTAVYPVLADELKVYGLV